jgi:hypothetical protein
MDLVDVITADAGETDAAAIEIIAEEDTKIIMRDSGESSCCHAFFIFCPTVTPLSHEYVNLCRYLLKEYSLNSKINV